MVRHPTRLPAERLERLLLHVRRGWERVRADPAERARARRWIAEHPSGWPELDDLWSRSLAGDGALASWLESGARPEAWGLEVPLHSVLAPHPFACLSPWSSPARSSRS